MTTDRDVLAALGWRPFFADQIDEAALDRAMRVVGIHRNAHVLSDGRRMRDMRLGRYWFRRPAEERPTVGDWVLVDAAGRRVETCLQRMSLLRRAASGPKADVQLIGANVDRLFIVTSCNDEFSAARLQRFLALAASAGVATMIVLTKADLAGSPSRFRTRARAVAPGRPVELVNALDGDSLIALEKWLRPAETVALLGSSGVGKSTLLNTLAGRELQATRPIREDDARGRHTTTSRALVALPSGALVLDGPGVRELGMTVAEEDLGYQDIEALAAECRFKDCGHDAEPGCAVQSAVQAGRIQVRRVESYRALAAERRRHERSLAKRDKRVERLERSRRLRANEDAEEDDE